MDPLLVAIIATGVPLLLLAGVANSRRLRNPGGAVLLGVAIVAAVATGVAAPAELVHLPSWTGLSQATLALAAWGLWSAAGLVAVRRLPPGPPLVSAALLGFVFGPLVAASVLRELEVKGAPAARLVVVATACSLVGVAGNPAMLLLAPRFPRLALVFLPVVVLGVLVALVRPDDLPERGAGRVWPLYLGLGGAVLATLQPAWAHLVLGATAPFVVLAQEPARWRRTPGLLPWVLASAGIVVLATAGGLPELAATGLELALEVVGTHAGWALMVCALVLALLVGPPAAALVVTAVLDRGLELDTTLLVAPLVLGVGLGMSAPLQETGGLRAGLLRLVAMVIGGIVFTAMLG